MAKWVVERRRISLGSVNKSHGTNPAYRSRTRGPIEVKGSWFWGYTVLDGNHRVEDARRRGRGSIEALVWRRA